MTVLIDPPLSVATTALRPARPARQVVTGIASLVWFYRRPAQLRGLVVASLVLSYGGGAVMFWLHGVYRGEQGPAISLYAHFLLDSTLGFIALTPPLGLLLLWADQRYASDRDSSRPRRLAVLVGPAFALVTGPGPLVHNQLVGRGTPLANLVTSLAGRDDMAEHAVAVQHPALTECLLQILVGVPVYTVLLLLTLTGLARLTQRRASTDNRRAEGLQAASPTVM